MTRTNHKLTPIATPHNETEWIEATRVWRGRGRVRAAAEPGGVTVVTVAGLTTQARAYKALVGTFFRKEWRGRPDAAARLAVDIIIEAHAHSPVHDVDNVAKAILDALTGAVFRDDSQVWRLVVERRLSERERVWVRVAPWPPAAAP